MWRERENRLTGREVHGKMPPMQSGAALLKAWIGRSGYRTQADVASAFGFKESFLSMLVNGKRAPSLDNAVKIERFTGIPVQAWSSSSNDKLGPSQRRRSRKRHDSPMVTANVS